MSSREKPVVENYSQDVHKVTFEDGAELYLIGTAHVSAESVRQVEELILEVKPDSIAVELDSDRLGVIRNRKRYEQTDIIQVFKSGKALFFFAQLMMSAYQKKIAKKMGVRPGAEFRRAVELSDETGAELVLADRNISFTLKRLMRKMSALDKAKLLVSMLFATDDDKDIDEEKLKEIKETDALTALIGEMGESMPVVKKVMLDERDMYLAGKVQRGLGKITVAVVGAAHVPGMLEHLLNAEVSEESLREVELIPRAGRMGKMLPWLIPLLILGLFVYGFFNGNTDVTMAAALYWVLINGVLSALGCLIALGHPLSILSGFIAAPITSLNPMIGAGMVTGLVQVYFVRPKIIDFEQMGDDAGSPKMWWKNRLTRALLVSIFASIGSAIGTFVAFPLVTKMLLS